MDPKLPQFPNTFFTFLTCSSFQFLNSCPLETVLVKPGKPHLLSKLTLLDKKIQHCGLVELYGLVKLCEKIWKIVCVRHVAARRLYKNMAWSVYSSSHVGVQTPCFNMANAYDLPNFRSPKHTSRETLCPGNLPGYILCSVLLCKLALKSSKQLSKDHVTANRLFSFSIVTH